MIELLVAQFLNKKGSSITLFPFYSEERINGQTKVVANLSSDYRFVEAYSVPEKSGVVGIHFESHIPGYESCVVGTVDIQKFMEYLIEKA